MFIKDDGVRIVEETAVKISTASLGTDERVMAYRERHDNVSPNSKLGCHLDSDCKYSDDKLLNTEQQNLIRSGSCNLEANQMSNEFVCEVGLQQLVRLPESAELCFYFYYVL